MEYNTHVGIFETGEKDSQGGAYKDNRFVALRQRDLNEYEVKDGVAIIGDRAFYDAKLRTVTLPNSLRAIGQSAFAGCKNLTDVALPEGLEVIKDTAFRDCKSLAELTLPSTLLEVGARAFGPGLKRLVILSENVTFSPDAFKQAKSLEEIHVPEAACAKYTVWFVAFGLTAKITEIKDKNEIEESNTSNNANDLTKMNFYEFITNVRMSYDYYDEQEYDEDDENYLCAQLDFSQLDDEEIERFFDILGDECDFPNEALWTMVDYDGELERDSLIDIENEEAGMEILMQYPEAFVKAAHKFISEQEGEECEEAIYGVGGYFWWGADELEEVFSVEEITM